MSDAEKPTADVAVQPLTDESTDRRVSTGTLVAAATALSVVVVVAVALLSNRGTNPPPSDEVALPTMVSTTWATANTTLAPSAPTTVPPEEIEVVSTIDGLGTLVWERIDGDHTSLPPSISEFTDSRYVAYELGGRWTSADATTWTFEEGAIGDYGWFQAEGEWGIASYDDGTDVLRRVGDTWVPVDLPEAPLPEVDGIDWKQYARMPRESGGVLVMDVTALGDIAWGDVFGTFEFPCGQSERCEQPPRGWWDADEEVLRIEHPGSGLALAKAGMLVVGNELHFVDRATDDLIYTVRGGPTYTAERIAEQIRRDGGSLIHPGGFVSADGGTTWSWTEFPWQTYAEILDVPKGGFAAFVIDYRWQGALNPTLDTEVWTSTDGVSWIERGDLGFALPGVDQVHVQRLADRLIGSAWSGYDLATGLPLATMYASTDALEWQPADLPFEFWHGPHETSFGTVVTSMQESAPRFWIRADDGEAWTEVPAPPDRLMPLGDGFIDGGATGDMLYMSFGSNRGPRTLWIGRFAP